MAVAQKVGTKKTKKEETLLDTVRSLVWVVLAVLAIRTFVFEPFVIPSGSLIPTLLVGDYVFVWKFGYGISKYSFPFWNPPFAGRIFGKLPQRGDIAVFRLPRDPSITYIKRIIGLPGDKIQVRNGRLFVNGEEAKRTQLEDFVDDEYGIEDPVRQFVETLPNGVVHNILQLSDSSRDADADGFDHLNNTRVYEVPADHVFAMGDNRTNSLDSREVPERNGVGYIPVENLIGPAEFKFFSFHQLGCSGGGGETGCSTVYMTPWGTRHAWWEIWWWPFEIRYSRLFTPVR